MKKIPSLICLICTLSTGAFAQNTTIDDLVDKGTKLHDQGKYVEAITMFRHALSLDSNAARPNYEMANTYIAMEKYQEAIYCVDKVIQQNDKFLDQAYTLKGTALDMLDQYDAALQTYREGVKKFPENYLLQYNTALTYYKAKQYTDAEGFAVDAIKDNMQHASSHLILGYCKYAEGKRAEALLCWYYFLLLEPNSQRAANTLTELNKLMNKGVVKEAEDKITINVSSSAAEGEFSAAEMMISLLGATKYTEKSKGKSEQDMFCENTETFFKILGELKENKDQKRSANVWWDNYVPFFYTLAKTKNMKTFAYYISSSENNAETTSWLKDHKTDIDKLSKWYDNYYKK